MINRDDPGSGTRSGVLGPTLSAMESGEGGWCVRNKELSAYQEVKDLFKFTLVGNLGLCLNSKALKVAMRGRESGDPQSMEDWKIGPNGQLYMIHVVLCGARTRNHE